MSKTSHTGILPLVSRILAADTSPLGMTHAGVREAAGLEPRQVTSALGILKIDGKCFSIGSGRHDIFYYATAERMESCRPAVEAHLVGLRAKRKAAAKERQREADKRYRARMGLPERTPRVAKPKPAPAPKPVPLAAPVTIRKTPAQKWSDAEPIVPKGVKVTVCPGYVPRTFRPPPFFRGDFTNEWQQLRERAE